jgi:hypothetical protein
MAMAHPAANKVIAPVMRREAERLKPNQRELFIDKTG